MKVSPSLLAGPLADMKQTLAQFSPAAVDLLHMDVMDGNFVPALTFGEAYCHEIAGYSDIPLDVHLMVENPSLEAVKYFDLQPHNITFHYEAERFPARLAGLIREQGIKAGIALNPATPVAVIAEIADQIDMVLLMTVEPGFYGQKFIPRSLERLEELNCIRENSSFEIQVDGGINDSNIADLAGRGADIAVAGSYIFKGDDMNARAETLKKGAATFA